MLTVRLDSEEPLVDQIVRGIRGAIAAGELRDGDELPPVRQLAGDLGVHLNTVARAYRELQASGLVHTARGRGTRVTATQETVQPREGTTHESLLERAQALLADAKLAGLKRAELDRIWKEARQAIWPNGRA